MDLCYVCGNTTPEYPLSFSGPGVRIDCPTCGPFRLSERTLQLLQERVVPGSILRAPHVKPSPQASGAIRELTDSGADVFLQDIESLLASVKIPKDPLDSIDKILLYIFRHATSAAEYVRVEFKRDYAIAYASTPEEFRYFLEKAADLNLLERNEYDEDEIRLTLDGWQRIRELRKTRSDIRQAFVAMWFAKDLNTIFFDAIQPALQACGYSAQRVDMAEYNEKIDDRIIAEIRKSGLLVADVTGHRAGVYFEAGFALGLGLPVIWTCRNSDLEKAHFDTRQYNHIVWETAGDLKEKLQTRIEATLPTWPAI